MPSDKFVQFDLFGNKVENLRKQGWDKGTHAVFVTAGASNHSNDERQEEDFYATDPIAGEWLMRMEKFDGPIWEPCAGLGHLAEVFKAHGFVVKATDLKHRGYGQGGVNFLAPEITEWQGDIISNPPFKFAQEIIEKALEIVPEGKKVCMFLRTLFLEGIGRRTLFEKHPPRRVWIASKRILCAKNGNFENTNGAAQSYAWYVWEKGYQGDTILKWFN